MKQERRVVWGKRCHGGWGRCSECGTTKKRHEGGGLCVDCYREQRNLTRKAFIGKKAATKRYKEKMGLDEFRRRHREYMRAYYQKNKAKIDRYNRKWMKGAYHKKKVGNDLWNFLSDPKMIKNDDEQFKVDEA